MARRVGWVMIAVLAGGSSLCAQPEGLSLVFRGTYTTSSEIFPNPGSPDPVKRSQSFLVDGFPGAGVEVRYRFPGTLVAVGASVEYQRATLATELAVAFRNDIPVLDGYRAIPLEFTGYFVIPFSTRIVQVYMGGGVGLYLGERTYELAGVAAPMVENSPGFGIHVVAGVGYALTEHLSLVGGMKFRDLQFSSTNAFPGSTITYNGAVINVGTTPFESRIHTDGIVFQLGASYTI
jgi:opacity protein-like surface antigen